MRDNPQSLSPMARMDRENPCRPFAPIFPPGITTRELAAGIVRYRGGRAVQGFAVYPAARHDIHTLKELLDIFPDLDGVVLIEPAYANRRILIYLLSFLSQWWHLEASGSRGQQLLELLAQDTLAESDWWRAEKVDFNGGSLDFQITHHSGKSTLVHLYAADYIVAPKVGNDSTGPYLPPETIRKRFPRGFSVSVAKFPGWNGHLAVGDSGEKFYERLLGETSAGGIIYVSNAHRPKAHFVRDGFLRPLYYSSRGIREEVAHGAFVLYEKLNGKNPGSSGRAHRSSQDGSEGPAASSAMASWCKDTAARGGTRGQPGARRAAGQAGAGDPGGCGDRGRSDPDGTLWQGTSVRPGS